MTNSEQKASWDLSFMDVLNMLSKDKKEDLQKVLDSSKGKAKKLIKERLNTFVEDDLNIQIEDMDTKIMEKHNGHL
jgi:hypothetical protein